MIIHRILGAIALTQPAHHSGHHPEPPAPAPVVVAASAETQPVEHPEDAADDPAIWLNRADPARSLILGTNKQGGLCVHDLSGTLLQFLPVGRINNVDVRQDVVASDGVTLDLAAASHREKRAVSLFVIEPAPDGPRVRELPGSPIPVGVQEPYGICLTRDPATGEATVYVNDKSGAIEAWRLAFDTALTPRATLVRTLSLGSQVEGMVVDDETGTLFVGEEMVGVWRFDAGAASPLLVVSAAPDGPLVPDVEGLAIARPAGRSSLLLVSSQGNNTFLALDVRPPHELVGIFSVGQSDVGAVEETDGIDVLAEPMGPDFPNGIFVAQDGVNAPSHQNFKMVDWRSITRALRHAD